MSIMKKNTSKLVLSQETEDWMNENFMPAEEFKKAFQESCDMQEEMLKQAAKLEKRQKGSLLNRCKAILTGVK